LDFISPHIYPKTGKIDASVKFVENNQTRVPLVITECSTLHCGEGELKDFINQIDGKYEGLVGHYFGKKPEDYKGETIIDALHKIAIEFFVKNNPN
jgi:hypothetical protein